MTGRIRSVGAALALLLTAWSPAYAQASGDAVYAKHCARCHEVASPRVPPREALQKMPAERIARALDTGAMMAVAFTMSRDERLAVASYLGTKDAIAGPSPGAYCASRTFRLPAAAVASWNGWSPGANNARFQPQRAARLSPDDVTRLDLKWAFGFEGDVSAFAQPTVIGNHVFVGSAGGVVHAIRADSGCLEWTFQANGPVRAAIVAAPRSGASGPFALLFGDMTGWFYALDATTGTLLWKLHVDEHDSTRLTAAAAVRDGIAYIPVASWEETRASDPDYPCCTFRGSVAAVRVADGRLTWRTYLVEEPKATGQTSRGVPQYGPSGAGVWSTPTIDPKRRLLYVTTGDNYSRPATALSDAVVALDLASGRVAWSRQMTTGDVFSGACLCGPDFDFGSSAILATANGRDLLLAGQKSGIVFALDPDRRGEIVWQGRVGEGGTNGGVQWGMSADGVNVYAAVSDVGRTPLRSPLDPRRNGLDPRAGGGLTALRVADGHTQWFASPIPCPESAPDGCSPAQPGAVSAIPGVVFASAVDGHLRAYASGDGRVIWDFNTMRDFTTVNGVPAHGGSIDGPGAVIAGGMVFITSGYPRNGGAPGNVLLAFAPAHRAAADPR